MRRKTARFLLAPLPPVLALLLASCGGHDEDTEPPTAPGGLTAQSFTSTSAHVMWDASTDDTGVVRYEVYRDGTKVKEVPASLRMVDVTGLKATTAYTFTVRARDAAGNVSPRGAAKATVTTASPAADDSEAPTRPGRLRGKADGARTVTLSWGGSTDNLGVASYDVLQNGTKIHSAGGGETTARLTGLRPGTVYSFTVRARDAAGNLSPETAVVDVTTPGRGDRPVAAPAGLKVGSHAKSGTSYLDLSWVPPKTGGEVKEYEIHLDGEFATSLVWGDGAPTERTTYELPVDGGKTYTVRMRAKLPDGTWGAFSGTRKVTAVRAD